MALRRWLTVLDFCPCHGTSVVAAVRRTPSARTGSSCRAAGCWQSCRPRASSTSSPRCAPDGPGHWRHPPLRSGPHHEPELQVGCGVVWSSAPPVDRNFGPALLCRHTSVPHKPGADSAVAHSDTMRGCELQQALPAMRCAALAKSARGVLCARQANSKLHQRTAHQGAGLSMMRLTGARQCASNFLHRWCRVPVARDSADAIRLARCLGGHCGVSGIRCPAAAAAHVSQEHAPDNQQSSSE